MLILGTLGVYEFKWKSPYLIVVVLLQNILTHFSCSLLRCKHMYSTYIMSQSLIIGKSWLVVWDKRREKRVQEKNAFWGRSR